MFSPEEFSEIRDRICPNRVGLPLRVQHNNSGESQPKIDMESLLQVSFAYKAQRLPNFHPYCGAYLSFFKPMSQRGIHFSHLPGQNGKTTICKRLISIDISYAQGSLIWLFFVLSLVTCIRSPFDLMINEHLCWTQTETSTYCHQNSWKLKKFLLFCQDGTHAESWWIFQWGRDLL